MSEMIERVSRALREQYDNRTTFEVAPRFSVMARAAIEAMREPTERVLDAGFHKSDDVGYLSNNEDVGAVWQAMIDAALKEPA